MFTIYNNGIVDYKGSTENLYNVKNVNESTKFTFNPEEGSIKDFKKEQDSNSNKKKKSSFYPLTKKFHKLINQIIFFM